MDATKVLAAKISRYSHTTYVSSKVFPQSTLYIFVYHQTMLCNMMYKNRGYQKTRFFFLNFPLFHLAEILGRVGKILNVPTPCLAGISKKILSLYSILIHTVHQYIIKWSTSGYDQIDFLYEFLNCDTYLLMH